MLFRQYRCRAVASARNIPYVTRSFISFFPCPKHPLEQAEERNDVANRAAANRAAPLQSQAHRDLLDIIDKLRSQGIGRFVDLPQIVVCGDQSSGKSSVLEAISGMSFPTRDSLCTCFATELALRRSPTFGVNVRIKPGPDRTAEDKKRLMLYGYKAAVLDISRVIEDAKEAMGIDSENKAFSTDVLHIEISGPTQPHLTLVDLPGLFLAGNKDQAEEDVTLVKSLVLSYMRKPRNIILAVVSANSDFTLQQVTGHARALDPKGDRTLGLITKPDTLEEGTGRERFFVELAQNRYVRFGLGWHVLRNRSSSERGKTSAERDEVEYQFFSRGVWMSLDLMQLGAAALRIRLSKIIWDQVVNQLPNVLEDIETEITECRTILRNLGAPRRTVSDQRKYLLGASMAFLDLMKAAIDGIYTNSFFGSTDRRLRAVVQNILTDFSEQMRFRGHAKIIQEYPDSKNTDPRCIFLSAYIEEVKVIMKQNRGQELPGSYNPLIVAELFRRQCKPWQQLVGSLTLCIFNSVYTAISSALQHVTDERTANALLRELISPSVEELRRNLNVKVEELLEPHVSGHPITHNHDLAAHVRNVWCTRQRRNLESKLISLTSKHLSKAALNAFLDSMEPNMEEDSCLVAIDMMQAYYTVRRSTTVTAIRHLTRQSQVARKKIVDDISVLAIERCVVQRLPGLFAPELVWNLPDAEIQRLAAESDVCVMMRERVTERLRVLEEGMVELGKMKKRDPFAR